VRIFFDTEFTGLHKNTTLISLGLVTETDESVYFEFEGYDKAEAKQTVLSELLDIPLPKEEVKRQLLPWLAQFDHIEMWGDCLSYNWVLFVDLFGSILDLPKNIYPIPFDIVVLFKMKGLNPDKDRHEFIRERFLKKHNALHDAMVIKRCYEKLNGKVQK
jgi:hypothetical protein